MTKPIALERFGSCTRGADGDPMDDRDGAPEGQLVAAAQEPEVDLQTKRLACLEQISSTLEIIASEQAGLRAQCTSDAVAALGAAAETLLPRLAQAGFAILVAETTQTIARRGQWPELFLSVAPAHAYDITSALAAMAAGTDVKITIDPDLGPSEVQLAWNDGGAEIDVEAIAEAALERFRLQLGGCALQGEK
jgi:hypothetical protein